MDNSRACPSETEESKNILPDVVHSQQIPTLGVDSHENIDTGQNDQNTLFTRDDDISQTESISEDIPSHCEYSTDSENAQNLNDPEKVLVQSTTNVSFAHSQASDNSCVQNPSKLSTSWPLDVNVQLISEESPVNLPVSSDNPTHTSDKSLSNEPYVKQSLSLQGDNASLKSFNSAKSDQGSVQTDKKNDDNTSLQSEDKSFQSDNGLESPKSGKYPDSLNKKSNDSASLQSIEKSNNNSEEVQGNLSSGSEEMIKLDIRGQGAPKMFPFPAAKIIFGPPPEDDIVIDQSVKSIPPFPNLLSPFLVGVGEHIKVQDFFDNDPIREPSSNKSVDVSPDKSLSDKMEQSDLLVEEITIDDGIKEKDNQVKTDSIPPKSIPVEEASFSTITNTEYKTICVEFNAKLSHYEDAITQRDQLIEELTISLQHSIQEHNNLKNENEHLVREVQNLQHVIAEYPISEHETIKGQLSDFIKYHNLVKDNSYKFNPAAMSGGTSIQSSNSEKDNVREEITVNYSKSDLKSSETSDDFQIGIEDKVATIINKFDECIEENLRNKLRESIIQVLCDEIGKMRIEFDTDMKELEAQLQSDKQAYTIETRRLRELLASVKAGNVDIEELRQELGVKHEKEMENLRTYFEKKCSDMERSYSEEVWRGRCASPLGSASSLDIVADAAGDYLRRRTRSAELPSLSLESTPLDQALKQISRKYEQQIDDLKADQVAYVNELQVRQAEAIASLEEQLTQLKAHIQTTENTEANVSIYQQDIDLELEKVLLSDPDAEVSSWPLELVALRDKIQGDVKQHEREVSSLRDELSCEDKWKQRRNHSFDQNRHLEEVTKERDDLKRVAVSLHRVVGQLVAYCACAEDELNRTVLAQLLARLVPNDDDSFEEELGPPSANVTTELSTSAVSRSGKHVHFAPDLNAILSDLDEDCIVGFLQHQRDLSADIKRELEHSLRRLRNEAHSLLDLSNKLANRAGRNDTKMLESSQPLITEMVQDLDTKQDSCNNCQLHRKNMEEAMSECLHRENLLRSDLEAAMIKIAQLMNAADVIAEGYGTGGETQAPVGICAGVRGRSLVEAVSLDGGASSPRAHLARLNRDIDLLHRDRDDLTQQAPGASLSSHETCREELEAANRQLKSTRQFVEEQATEREAERDEFAKQLADLRGENSRLAQRLQNNARILNEVENLETQTREMNQIINDLETRKAQADDELKAMEEKIVLLRDIIANLEHQLEQKTVHEREILDQLEEIRRTIDDRDSKMRNLLGELESLRSEKVDQSDVSCVKCGQEEDKLNDVTEKFREQCRWLEGVVHRRTRKLERIHEVCSTSCSEPSEDVSLRDQRDPHLESKSPERISENLSEALGVWECLQAHTRAEDALLKRVADLETQRAKLKDIAQEVRAERDVLQARMSEQALKISSLSARLQQQRNDAEAMSHQATSQLTVQLHDALAEVQRMKEELESKDKQLVRLKQKIEEKDKISEHSVYGNLCNPKDKVIILERELSAAQSRIAQLESLVRTLEADKEDHHDEVRNLQRDLAQKDEQMQELLALKLGDDKKDESDHNEPKISARTLSDIVSISEFDEQDLQMRRAELKAQNVSSSDARLPSESRDKVHNKTLPPEHQKPDMSSLNIDFGDHFELPSFTPRADSLPAHLTSTQNKVLQNNYKRNLNEVTLFGTTEKFAGNLKNITAQIIQDNCSMYPNRNISESKNVTVAPKKINFSLDQSNDNRDEEEFTSLRELGITLDVRQENFPDILTQLKHEIKKSRAELDNCKSDLKNAEEQLCEFPALKEEVEELKGMLENTVATMQNDKKFYENQLENFSSNKKLLEQRMAELTQEVSDKSKDLHLLKEDILRRENMILELAKEKRNLTNKLTELEVKIDELQSRNAALEKCEIDNHQLREKNSELKKLENLVSEKNQQIDSLNQHLDRLDDLQRCLNDKTEEYDHLKDAFEDKCSKLVQLQETIKSLNRDIVKLNDENNLLTTNNKELRVHLTKLEKEQENASLKLQKSENELDRVNTINNEMSLKIQELKLLTDQLKDKETEIEILHEDISAFHEEIASLKEQLKMVSRSPSPRKNEDDRQASNDKKQLTKIRKQISLLQHELDFNKKELNDKAFELAKAKLDVTELKNNLNLAIKQTSDKDSTNSELKRQVEELQIEIDELTEEKNKLMEHLESVLAKLKEESNVSELKSKLRHKTEKCQQLEIELHEMKDLVERLRECSPRTSSRRSSRAMAVRSPTAELERAVRDQLNYSHALDEHIMEQILSASSDEHEEIPRLALNTSKSTSSIHSTSSDRVNRLRVENDKLQMQVSNLESRLKDKDALITELNRVRDKLVQDWQTSKLRYEAERDNSGRLQLLLDTHKHSAEALQNQDSNMIQILKKRLESAMQSELELQHKEQQYKTQIADLERRLQAHALASPPSHQADLHREMENNSRLRGEVSLLKSKLEVERSKLSDLQALLEHNKLHAQRDLHERDEICNGLRNQLAEIKRQKHETSVELVRAKEQLNSQAANLAQLEKRLSSPTSRPLNDALTEIETHKTELAREIATLKKCLADTSSPEIQILRSEKQQLSAKVEKLEAELYAKQNDEKDQAIRFLHCRCLRLESCRKALVWQKRYLQRVLDGYNQLERNLRLPLSKNVTHSNGKGRFKCVATAVIVVIRMGFLVRRRHQLRALSTTCFLRVPATDIPSNEQSTSPPTKDRVCPGSEPRTPRQGVQRGNESLAKRLFKQDLRLNLPSSPGLGDFMRWSPHNASSPREEPFILSSPRSEVAAAYLNKLGLVSRCLNQAMDSSRDVP